jgi:hypothetical protein
MARIISAIVDSQIDHNNLADLTVGDDHTQYALLAGRATPQQLNLGTASGASTGYLSSTVHATKGKYFLNAAGTITVDELNERIGLGTPIPAAELGILKNGVAVTPFHFYNNSDTNLAYTEILLQYSPVDTSFKRGIRFLKDATGANYGSSFGFLTELNQATQSYDYRLYIQNANIGIGTTTQFGSGSLVIGLTNAFTVPTTNPTGGGVLYCEAGALKYRGSSGTVTTLGIA